MKYNYVNIDRVFKKYTTDYSPQFNEDDLTDWIGEALEFIGVVNMYETAVSFQEVRNHQCQLPRWMHSIIQVARNNGTSLTPALAYQEVTSVPIEVPNIEFVNNRKDTGYVLLDEAGTPIVEYDVAYYRPYFDLIGEFYGWQTPHKGHNRFTPVRLSDHSFFDSLVCKEFKDSGLYRGCLDEYKITGHNTLRFSFETGQVGIAFYKQGTDCDNRPLVPDNISCITACATYCAMKTQERDEYNSREGATGRANKLRVLWDKYCGQASNAAMMPQGTDAWEAYTRATNHLIPPKKYFGFFGNCPKGSNRANINSNWNGSEMVVANASEVRTITNNTTSDGSGGSWTQIDW